MLKKFPLLFLFFLLTEGACAQLRVQRIIDLEKQVANELFGEGVEVVSVRFKGYEHAIALFEDDSMTVDIPRGILLTSGMALNAIGPNFTTGAGSDVASIGDRDLTKLVGYPTYDAAVLELEVIPKGEFLSFNYVFASEEYKEYVDKSYNDVFALFLKSPGQRDLYNLARIPATKIPIAIDNVNHLRSTLYFVDNDYDMRNLTDTTLLTPSKERSHVPLLKYPSLYPLQYDGFTRVMRALANVRPGEKYLIKIAIADVGDRILDSGVFLEAGSFISNDEPDYRFGVLKDPEYYLQAQRADSLRKLGLEERILHPKRRVAKKPNPNTTIPDTVAKVVEPEKLVIDPLLVYFDFDKDDVSKRQTEQIKKWVQLLETAGWQKVTLEGNTDNWGSEEYNVDLGTRRAEQVKRLLISYGYPKDLLTVKSEGEHRPKASNKNSEGRQQNRRVETLFFQPH